MSRIKKLFSDTLVIALGTFGSKLLVFLLMPLYTALLSTSEYSTAELITSTANLIIPIACVGIGNGIFRFAAEKNANKEAVFSSGITLLGIGSALFLLLSPLLLCVEFFDGYVFLIVLYVLFANLQAVCAQYIRAIDRTRLYAFQGIFNTLCTILLNLLFLLAWDMGVTGYVLSVILGNLLTTVLLVFAAKLWESFHVSMVKKRLVKELLFFSLPMVPTTVCWLITDLSDRYMVTYFCGSDINGIYSAAYKIPTLVILVSNIFMQAWQFSAVAESSDEESCKQFYSRVFQGYLSLILIGSAGLILLSEFLAGLLLHSNYHGAWEYMPTLLCAAALESIVSFLATVYMVKKKSMHSFLTAIAGAVLNVVLNLLLIPRMGALGAAIATLAGYGFVMLLRLLDAPRMIRFRLYLPRLTVSIVLLLISAAFMTFASSWRLLGTGIAVLLILGINLWPLWQCLQRLLHFRRKKDPK
ncbi:MAG: polysaccharide biosynthesis C-terminal domain-containing protein [Clostridia bacterium]|nr:polysaccharide biosynthesis C-terminal domain-containing protein [Clostridia bacterium]